VVTGREVVRGVVVQNHNDLLGVRKKLWGGENVNMDISEIAIAKYQVC
jgi:hypothetical protein